MNRLIGQEFSGSTVGRPVYFYLDQSRQPEWITAGSFLSR
jgi:hypothetical protein